MIYQLLAGTLPDPDGGAPLQVATRSVAILPTLKNVEADFVKPLGLGKHLAVVSDSTTHGILGARVVRALESLGQVSSILLPGRPHPDGETVEKIRKASASADALVAVGSGTINDLCKYASAQDRKPYIVYATAPSMNGYTSVNAAITDHGHKKSLAAQAPVAAFFDLDVLTASPPRMIRSGLGDSLCRPTAQADWMLAHLLLDQPYRTMPFVLLENDEAQLFAESDALMRGDMQAMRCLVRTLLLSGFGTAIYGSSHPASQGEHLISHYADMFGDHGWPESFHGEQIGVTTLTMARLQERLLEGPAPTVHVNGADETAFTTKYGPELGKSCWKEFAQKRLDAGRAKAVNQRLADSWDKIREAIARITIPAKTLRDVLQRAAAPMQPEDLGWPRQFYLTAVKQAREIRNRYTFLDLASDSGKIEPVAALT